jgi:tetratricopeptide (TPR) repeat protein
LTEELIADLAGIKALSVISRTSAMLFKGTDKDLPTIGRELGVRYVLEGSVRKAGSSLRITAQLVDAEKDTPLWSEKYNGSLEEVFEVQERVSREIVRALDITLTSDESRRLAERPIENLRAFELYLQARQEIRRFDVKALDRAAKLVSQAVEIEGETPPLVFLMALAKVTQAKAGVNPDPHQLEEVEAQALALLERTPDLPQAHTLLGSICYERGWLPQAVWHCKRALEGTSNDAEAFLYLGASYMAAGQPGLGLDAGLRMVECDPLASISWMIQGAARWFVGRTDEAVPDLEHSLELDPQNFLNHWAIGYTYASLGRLAEAGRHAASCHEAAPENAYAVQVLSLVDALEGRQDVALERLADVDITPLDPHNKFHLSESFAMAGDTRRALEVLEISVDQGFYPYPFINEYCPFMAPLRSLPEFAPILAKSKEKTEAFCEDGPLRPFSQDAPGETP